MKLKSILFTLLSVSSFALTKAQQLNLQLDSFSAGYSLPLGIENCGDNRLFIVQQNGQVFICTTAGQKVKEPFLDIRGRVNQRGGERGLLGLAFDPQYIIDGYIYVNYINTDGNTQISRFSVSTKNRNMIDTTTEASVLKVQQPYINHNGGDLRFGPDGFLYIPLGDGGSEGDPGNNAQNPQKLLGKVLRIDVSKGLPYAIPPSNPFKKSTIYQKEIWTIGFRNPWRFSFDDQTGDMWIGDVGQAKWEEIDMQPAKDAGGENYGWRCYEGNHPYNLDSCNAKNTYTFPLVNYSHLMGDCAVIGGFVYRGKQYANMFGKYFYTDFCSGNFRMLFKDSGTWKNTIVLTAKGNFDAFGEDSKKELYVVDYSSGVVYHLYDASATERKVFIASNFINASLFSVYPNPSKGSFFIQYNSANAEKAFITIDNALGQKVFIAEKTLSAGTNNLNINLANPASGYYYLRIQTNSGKLFKQPVLIQ